MGNAVFNETCTHFQQSANEVKDQEEIQFWILTNVF